MPEMKIQYVPIGTIRPYEKNPRINDNAVDACASSIKEYGFKVPIIIDGGVLSLRAIQGLKPPKS